MGQPIMATLRCRRHMRIRIQEKTQRKNWILLCVNGCRQPRNVSIAADSHGKNVSFRGNRRENNEKKMIVYIHSLLGGERQTVWCDRGGRLCVCSRCFVAIYFQLILFCMAWTVRRFLRRWSHQRRSRVGATALLVDFLEIVRARPESFHTAGRLVGRLLEATFAQRHTIDVVADTDCHATGQTVRQRRETAGERGKRRASFRITTTTKRKHGRGETGSIWIQDNSLSSQHTTWYSEKYKKRNE